MKKIVTLKNSRYGHAGLLLLIILAGGIYLYLRRDQLDVLRGVGLGDALRIFLATMLFFSTTSYTFQLTVRLLKGRFGFLEAAAISIVSNYGNYFGPTLPGIAIKAVYLKDKGLEYSQFTAVLAANVFLLFFMTGLSGALLLGLLAGEVARIPPVLLTCCVALVVVSFLPWGIKYPRITSRGRVLSFLRSAIEGFDLIKEKRMALFGVCLSLVFQFAANALVFKVTFGVLGHPLSYVGALVIGVFTTMGNLILITPSNVGVQEIVIAYLVSITGYDFTLGIIGSGLARISHMVFIFVTTPICVSYLAKHRGTAAGGDIGRDGLNSRPQNNDNGGRS